VLQDYSNDVRSLIIAKAALYGSLPQEVKFIWSFSAFSLIHLNAGSYLSKLHIETKDDVRVL
jgi:hypothetical protein